MGVFNDWKAINMQYEIASNLILKFNQTNPFPFHILLSLMWLPLPLRKQRIKWNAVSLFGAKTNQIYYYEKAVKILDTVRC